MYRSKDKILEAEGWELQKRIFGKDADTAQAKALKKKRESIKPAREAWRKEFVKKYPDTYAAVEVFNMYCDLMENSEAMKQFNSLSPKYRNTPLGLAVKTRLEAVSVTSAGKKVIPFRQPGIDGKTVDIAALKGKVVLIDCSSSYALMLKCVPSTSSD